MTVARRSAEVLGHRPVRNIVNNGTSMVADGTRAHILIRGRTGSKYCALINVNVRINNINERIYNKLGFLVRSRRHT